MESLKTIDLNCDMGESYGAWARGDDEGIMPHITSANLACGAHGGDPDVMANAVKLAARYKVTVGAHPGYPDIKWFGRKTMDLSHDETVNLILYQIGALWAVALSQRVELRYVKPHGALYNQACRDAGVAEAVTEAIWRFSPSLQVVGLPDSKLMAAAQARGLSYLREGFADRAYEPTGQLRDRRYADSIITDPELAAEQALQLANGSVTAHEGTILELTVDTICVHGDTPGAPVIASAVRQALTEAQFNVAHPGVY